MKKLRLLVIIVATALVAQLANAQTVHEEWVIPFEDTWVYCLDENASGELVYDVKYKYDKDGNLIWFSMHNKGGFIIGSETGNTYKYIDKFHEKYGVPPNEDELKISGILKIISLGDGKVYEGRIQVHIVVDKCGEVIEKKFVWTICF